MSYTKHAWVTGETITAEKLNNIEDGVDDLTRQLSDLDDDKQDAPSTAGTAGQVLALDDNLNPVWANQSSGGTTDYAQLSNKPSINNVELSGNKTLDALGINAGSIRFDESETYIDGSIGAEVSNQKNAISELDDAVINGYNKITSDYFVNSGSRKLVLINGIKIQAGDSLSSIASSLYWRWSLTDAGGTIVEEVKGQYDRTIIKTDTHVFQHDGTLNIQIGNGHNYGNSTDIVPADMTADIRISTSYSARKIKEIEPAIEDTKYITVKRLAEEPTATGGSGSVFQYYRMDFIPGQNYIVKIKFSAFDGTYSRKYSLRTTTDQYVTSAYEVQNIVIVNDINPVLDEEYIYRFTATAKANGEIGRYLAVELNPGTTATCTVDVYSVLAEDNLTALDKLNYLTATDIVSLNHDVPNYIAQGNKPLNRATTNPFKLLHFSDIHAATANLQRLVAMNESLGSTIDDCICTGDMVANNYSETCMDFWDSVDGAENILIVVGNHDLADGQHGYSSDQIGQTVAYQTYFAPYISNWGVTMAGENLTYWYKDYASKNVRLIGLNYLLTGDALSAQNTWLAARLAEAKTAGYTVVIAEHTPPSSYTSKACNFEAIGIGWSYNEFPTSIQDVVKDFIDGGGKFACYIGGHAHCDHVGYNSNYPTQLFVNITTALTTGSDNDQYRAAGTKSQDAANIFMVDTVTQTIKLIRVGADMDCYLRGRHLMSINYATGNIIAES